MAVLRLVDYLILFLYIFSLMEFFTFLRKMYFLDKLFVIIVNKKRTEN